MILHSKEIIRSGCQRPGIEKDGVHDGSSRIKRRNKSIKGQTCVVACGVAGSTETSRSRFLEFLASVPAAIVSVTVRPTARKKTCSDPHR